MRTLAILIFCISISIITSAQTNSLDPLLSMSLEELLNQKITTAGKQEQLISDVPASVVVISRNEIEAYGYQSLQEILSNVLGMYALDNYQNLSFGVRGFFTNIYTRNIIFLINGVRQQQPLQNYNDLFLMNLQVESIERIEVVRGTAGVLYGNDAFFGVINIITHDKNTITKSSVSASYGSNNTYRGNVQVNSISEDVILSFSAGYKHSDERDIPFSNILDSVQNWDGSWIKDGTTKDFFTQNNTYFNAHFEHKGIYSNISFNQFDRNLIHIFAPVYGTTKLSIQANIIRSQIGYRRTISEKFSFDVNTSYESWASRSDYTKLLIRPDVKSGATNSKVQNSNTELLTVYKPKKNINITTGFNYNVNPYANTESDLPAIGINRHSTQLYSSRKSYAAFINIEYNIKDKIIFYGGIRADKQNNYDYKNIKYLSNTYLDTIYTNRYDEWNFIPNASIIYKHNPKNIFKLMYGQAISSPSLYENSYSLWGVHPQLLPQKISTTELNFSSISSDKLTYSISTFYNRLDNMIVRRVKINSGGGVSAVNTNSGKLETFGGELQVSYYPIQILKFDASFSYQKTENKLFEIDAAYSPSVLAYLKAIYNFKEDMLLGVSTYYVGSMESAWDEIEEDRISTTTPAYFNMSMNLRFNNIFKSMWFVSLHADNLLNSSVYYAPTNDNIGFMPNGTYDTGIKINASLGLKF